VSITFSAKGVTFEGVREVLNVHKGNLLANLMDFHVLTVDIVDKKRGFELGIAIMDIRRMLFIRMTV
jgi:hypothetical protein